MCGYRKETTVRFFFYTVERGSKKKSKNTRIGIIGGEVKV